MYPLKPLLSQNGFTSSESYDHAVQCFLSNPTDHIRCMHVDGDCGRKRTAFAHALANALCASQIMYYEFGKDKSIPQIIRIQEGEEIIEEPPVEALDRILTEACAQSEAEQTVLILDQLHKTQFLNHIRLYEFLQTGLWRYSDVQYQANLSNLSVYLISDEPLYHSLQSCSFRLWISEVNRAVITVSAEDLGLNEQNCQWLLPVQKLLGKINLSPTLEEYQRLAFDIEQHVHNKQQLKVSLFGWLENIDRIKLESEELQTYLDEVLEAILMGKGVGEEIEISGV
ncbi:MAG: hypothetical protein DIZ80_12330 [endosymbiont of Galathealinum brachiosum]|uniref:Uncharacterized protein n=1 Tax=endosymbiont of Galathealinum brachiosum TaxID=2200906 RepID=A0A370DDS7_9GAMM|nr:MAG: hypothetical protein DIZ80_12330 [endosymbiont of Galathealinum brachiosum]